MAVVKRKEHCYIPLEQHLRREVCLGKIPAHAKIGSETVLCRRFGISRFSVRTALQNLKNEGVLYSIRGKGTFAADIKKRQSCGFHRKEEDGKRRIVLLLLLDWMSKDMFMQHGTFEPIMSGIEKILFDRGFEMTVIPGSEKELSEREELFPPDTAGILFIGEPGSPFYHEKMGKYPCVGIYSQSMDLACGWVHTDYRCIGYTAVRHLRELGHWKIGFFSPFNNRFDSGLIYQGYLEGMSKTDAEVEPAHVYLAYDSTMTRRPEKRYPDFSEAVHRLFCSGNPPTALICLSNFHMRAVIRCLNKIGLKVPRDVSIVGGVNEAHHNDGDDFTCLVHRSADCCYQATRLLLDAIGGQVSDLSSVLLLRPVFLPGSSTAPLKAGERMKA